MSEFKKIGLEENLILAVEKMGFETPSEVQIKTIPILLEKDTDLVALAQTGTGKTAAFGLPMIQKIDVNSKTTQGLILSPTRELCLQITNEIKQYGQFYKGLNVTAIYGGASITDQARSVKRGAQIIVATPGRMKDMIKRRLVDISQIKYSVLDEADEMLNMGFYEDITDILSGTPDEKNTWLFSATMPKEVSSIAKKFMNNPIEITVGTKNVGSDQVSHEYYLVKSSDRYVALKRLVDANPHIFSVIFCRTKRDTQKVAEKLIEDGYNAGALHGDLSQGQRDLVMKSFRNKQIQFLVATDVAARGIDVDNITHVINYQLPDEIETYTHRSGRTGRAGKTGISLVIVSKSEIRKIGHIQKKIKKEFIKKDIPSSEEICKVQLFTLANKVNETEVNTNIDEYIDDINNLFKKTKKADLIKKFFSVEFNRYFDYYKKSKNLNIEGGNQHSYSDFSDSEDSNSARFFINVGQKDGYDWMSLKDFLKEVLELGKDEVFKVDVKESFSFFNTEEGLKEKVLAFFTDFKQNGRFVNVEISQDIKRNSGKGRSNRGGDRRGGGGFRKSNSSRDFNKSNSRSSGSRDYGGGSGSRRSGSRESEGNSSPRRSESRVSEGNSSPRRSKSFNADSSSRPRRDRRK
ncbi:MAG: DEAD/DEAH box helicase [Flavobacteriales bacterium]|tara:strand:- start:45435 stop:47336 length:1902 start_codon:yes stop_codon:yes gene_type:complete